MDDCSVRRTMRVAGWSDVGEHDFTRCQHLLHVAVSWSIDASLCSDFVQGREMLEMILTKLVDLCAERFVIETLDRRIVSRNRIVLEVDQILHELSKVTLMTQGKDMAVARSIRPDDRTKPYDRLVSATQGNPKGSISAAASRATGFLQ